jgi:hypothetical protein
VSENTGGSDETTSTQGGASAESVEEIKLHQLVEELEAENQALREEQHAKKGRGKRRARSIFSWVLIVLACLLAVVSVVAVYARNELLNTDTFVATIAPLAKDAAVQTVVATKVSEAVVAKGDIEQRVKDALPAKADFLAAPIATGVQTLSYQATLKVVQSSQFQKLWDTAVRASHAQVDTLLTGGTEGAVSTANGQVTVNLSTVETEVKKRLSAKGLTFINSVPNYSGAPVVLFQSQELLKLQRTVRLLNKLVLLLPILALFSFAGAVALALDRRKGVVRASGGLALSMALLLTVANVARNQYLNSLVPGQVRNARTAVIDTVDAPLLDSVRAVLIVSVVILVVALIAGNRQVQAWVTSKERPSWLTSGPVHDAVAAHRRAYQWAVLALGLAVLVLWSSPTVFVAVVVVLVTLAAVGLVGLFAGRTGDESGEASVAGMSTTSLAEGPTVH